MLRHTLWGAVVALAGMMGAAVAFGQPPSVLLLKQDRDGVPAQNLSASEMSLLGDPLFNLVLKEKAHLTNLAAIENLIQPDASKRQTFVVDENIADPQLGQSRRSVLTFSGSNGIEALTANVMLSVFFDSDQFSDTPTSIEAWGWDNHRGRYNFYKLDSTGTPDQRLSWKFRGSSEGADLLSPSDRRGTCLACHVNGVPIMKELAFPWNNWHSFKSIATYLTQSGLTAQRWPVASSPHLAGGRLTGAERLEVDGILPAITQYNVRRVNASLMRRDSNGSIAVDAQGMSRVIEAKRLLRPLFFTTEINLVSSGQKSGLHPFPMVSTKGPSEDVFIPDSVFLNANLIGGGTQAKFVGLGIKKSQEFSSAARVSPAEYRDLVVSSGVQLGRRRPGDADFAWLVPEPSHVDNDLIDRLIRRGLVTPEFVAAVMAVDLEMPVLSKDREALGAFLPESYLFRALDPSADPLAVRRHPDALTQEVIANLERVAPAIGTPQAEWLLVLKDPDPLKRLAEKVEAYQQRTMARLQNPAARQGELKRLFDMIIQRRRAVLAHQVLRTINETGDRLFPLP